MEDLGTSRSPSPGVEIGPGVSIPESAMRFSFARSSGPGGQNVNKLNTKAELWVRVDAIVGLTPNALGRLKQLAGRRLTKAGEIHLVDETGRSQEGNRLGTLERLREMLVTAMHEPKRRKKTRPSASAKRKRLDAKKHRGETKARRRGDFE